MYNFILMCLCFEIYITYMCFDFSNVFHTTQRTKLQTDSVLNSNANYADRLKWALNSKPCNYVVAAFFRLFFADDVCRDLVSD